MGTNEPREKTMNKRLLLVSALLFTMTLSGAYWMYSSSGTSKYKYNTVTLSKSPQTSQIRVTGSIHEESLQPLYFKEDGFVTEILVQPGTYVKTGDTLATLDINKIDLQYLQKLKNIKIDFISKNSVDSYFNKMNHLEKSGFYSKEEAASLKMNMAENVRNLLSLQESITKLESRTEGKVIKAPFDGIVTDINWKVGEKVSASKQLNPAINIRRKQSIFMAKLELSEDVAGQVLPNSHVEFNLPLNQKTISGIVTSISSSLIEDNKNRYVPGFAKLDLTGINVQELKNGARLQGLVKMNASQQGVWIPRAAIDIKIPDHLVSQTLSYFSKDSNKIARKLASQGGITNTEALEKLDSVSPPFQSSQNNLVPNESNVREIYLLTGSKKIIKVFIEDGPGDERYTLINIPELEGTQVIVNVEPVSSIKDLFFVK
jgi:RND family efflux transporter MFP subunit